jgi:chromosome segregation protein
MAQYWAQFTNGQPDEGGWRYASVRIGAGHALQIQAAGGIELTPDQLSVGARDQLYLAMRLAVADVLAEDATLPLVLDDALVNYDAERRRRALTLLDQIAAERQVILLSHDAYYVEWAAQVHRLGDG